MSDNNDNALNNGQDGDKYQGFQAYTEEPIGSDLPDDKKPSGNSSGSDKAKDKPKSDKTADKDKAPADSKAKDAADKDGDDDKNADDQSDKRRSPRRFEKRISRLTKRAKENSERAERAERELTEAREKLAKYEAQESRPKSDQFDSQEEFEAALEKWSREQAGKKPGSGKKNTAKTAEEEEFEDALADVMDIFEENSSQYDDFKDVVFNDKVTITPPMVVALADTEDPTAIAYHLGKNPEEAARIAKLSPVRQAKEIGKLEAMLAKESKPDDDDDDDDDDKKAPAKSDDSQKRQSKAPRPIDPVKGSDASDKDISDMSFNEFEQARAKERSGKKKFW